MGGHQGRAWGKDVVCLLQDGEQTGFSVVLLQNSTPKCIIEFGAFYLFVHKLNKDSVLRSVRTSQRKETL